MLRSDAGHEVVAHVVLREGVVVHRVVVARYGYRNGVAAVALRGTIPGDQRVVLTRTEVEVVVNVSHAVAIVHRGGLLVGRRGQQIGLDGQINDGLVALVGRGKKHEANSLILVVERCYDHLVALRGRELDILFVACLHTPTNRTVVEREVDVTIERGRNLQLLAEGLNGRYARLNREAGGDSRIVATVALRKTLHALTHTLRIPAVVATEEVVGVVENTLLILQAVGLEHRLAIHDNRVVGLVGTDHDRLAVGRYVVLVATQPIGGRVGPAGVEMGCAVVAAIYHRERILRLAEVLARHLVLDIEVAIEEDGTTTIRVVEGLLAVETEGAVEVQTRAGEGIVGRLHVALLEEDARSTGQRTHVQTAQEVDVARHDAVAVAVGNVSLGDGRRATLATQLGLERIFEVDVAEVTHREVLEAHAVAVQVEHREVADSTLRLTACRG